MEFEDNNVCSFEYTCRVTKILVITDSIQSNSLCDINFWNFYPLLNLISYLARLMYLKYP